MTKLRQLLPDLGRRTLVMGILNVTPDSFSDGGEFVSASDAVHHGLRMLDAGADILDIGGESTRPGAPEVSEAEELRRVLPAIKEIMEHRSNAVISIDTTKAAVARQALASGASIVNDVSGFSFDDQMAATASEFGAPAIVMHMQGTPRTMQKNPMYDDIVADISEVLEASLRRGEGAGLSRSEMIVDPGIGFGKTVDHNLEILARLSEFSALGCPILVGTSRKSFIGKLTGRDRPIEREHGTSATHAVAIANGADILRVHDVRAAVDVSRVCDSVHRS